MLYTRRDIGRIALATGAAAKLRGVEKPNSDFNGVQIGAITYSYRQLPNTTPIRCCNTFSTRTSARSN
jgi:hypothetical protein